MQVITININTEEGMAELNSILDKLYQTNKVFTAEFTKVNGEYRIVNGTAKNYKQQAGTGTKAMSATEKRKNHDVFSCYENQITKKEKQLVESSKGQIEPKQKGFKSFKIKNLQVLRAFEKEYRIIS